VNNNPSMGMEEYTPEKRAAASPGPWLDIASAPKDGTHFLWVGDNGEFARRRWTFSVIWWPEFEDCFNSGHWQPLPAPPGSEAPVPDLLAEAVKVMEPLVDHARNRVADDPAWSADDAVQIWINIGDLRAAADFLAKMTDEGRAALVSGSEAPVPDEVRKVLEDIDRDYENQDISHHDFRVNTKVAVDDLLARWGK